MRNSRLLFISIGLLFFISGCAVGHKDFVSFKDDEIGTVMRHKEPYKFDNSGEFRRSDYVISGQGLTHISQNSNGNKIYHYSMQQILPNTRTKQEWVGKCLIYYEVDPDTYVIKSWGFDEGGNPLSCRTWP